jgi:hypothetical protein
MNRGEDFLFDSLNILSYMREGADFPIEKMGPVWVTCSAAGINPVIRLCFLVKSYIENMAFDPRVCSSVSCIGWSSCFKLWDPGGH